MAVLRRMDLNERHFFHAAAMLVRSSSSLDSLFVVACFGRLWLSSAFFVAVTNRLSRSLVLSAEVPGTAGPLANCGCWVRGGVGRVRLGWPLLCKVLE